MRIRIIFSLKNKGAIAPFHHQNMLADFIKQQMANNAQDLYPFYNFSGLKGQTKISRLGLHFYSSRITLVVSSLSKTWVDSFLKTIFEQKELLIGDLQLIPEYAEEEHTPILENPTKYVCISPIVITKGQPNMNHAKKFVDPEDDTFSDFLYDAILQQMENTGLYTADELSGIYKFQIVPDKIYLQKIKAQDKKFARIYATEQEMERVEFRGYTFPFTLYANEIIHNFLFKSGLGYHTTDGFGMIDTVQTQQVKQTSIYTV